MKAQNIADIYDLSPLQQGLLFHALYEPQSGSYLDQHSIRLQGPLQLDCFREAWQEVMNRHAILRTSFHWQKLKKPVQVIRKEVQLPWHYEDWSAVTANDCERKLQEWLQADRTRGFELGQPPLFRISAFKLAEQTTQIVFSRHHLLMDGWSRMLLYQEVLVTYQTLIQNQPLPMVLVPPFQSYIHWLHQQDPQQAQAYWQQQLQGITAPTHLTGDLTVSDTRKASTQYESQHRHLPHVPTETLQSFARKHKLTLNTPVMAAWSILLGQFAGETDVIFGVTSSGRPPQLPQAEQIIGPLINTSPLRVNLSSDKPLLQWLQTLQAQQAEMRQYEYCPLTDIQAWSDVPPGVPLFESLAIFENYPTEYPAAATEEHHLQILNTENIGYTHYPLTLYVTDGPQIKIELAYRCDCYSATQIQQYLDTFQELLSQLPTAANRPLSALTGLTSPTRGRPAPPAIDEPRKATILHLPLQTETERQLAALWATLLNLDRETVGPLDNFFELGGHSLLYVRLLTQVQEAFEISIPLRSLFDRPILKAQGELIDAVRQGTDLDLETIDDLGEPPSTPGALQISDLQKYVHLKGAKQYPKGSLSSE